MNDNEEKKANPLIAMRKNEERKKENIKEKQKQEEERKVKEASDAEALAHTTTPSKLGFFQPIVDIYPIILNALTLISILGLFLIITEIILPLKWLIFVIGLLWILLSYGFMAIIYKIYLNIRRLK